MKRIDYLTTLTCVQQKRELKINESTNGTLTRKNKTFLFEEGASKPTKRHHRNTPLFSGNLLSLTRLRNGRYQLHLNTLDMKPYFDVKGYAADLYLEVLRALEGRNL